jgi:hypothetical protein
VDSLLLASNGLLGKCKDKSLSIASDGLLVVCVGILDLIYRRRHLYTIESFRDTIDYHPYHFWQQADDEKVPVTSQCNTLVFQNSWKGGRAGRQEIERAIRSAKSKIKDYLGYRIGPEYVTRDIRYSRPYDPRMESISAASRFDRIMGVNVGEGYIKEVGVESFDTIDDTASITYTDENGDSINDTGTVTIAGISSNVTVDNVACYITPSERTDGSSSPKDQWKIEPENVYISGSTLTIKFKSWVMIKPKNYLAFNNEAHNPNNSASFLSTIQVKRRYTKTDGQTTDDSQAVFVWEANPPGWADCSSSNPIISTDPAAVGVAVARCGIRDARLGVLIPGLSVYNSSTSSWSGVNWSADHQPDRVIIRYLAGADIKENTEQNRHSGDWETIITNLAIAELAKHICSCESANSYIDEMSEDLARISGNADKLFRVSEADLNNPFGTRRGHVHAWNRIKNLALTRAFSI